MRRRAPVAVAVAALLVLGLAAGAGARTAGAQRAHLASALSDDLATVATLQSSISSAGALTAPHALVLGADLGVERTTLVGLAQRVARASTASAVAALSPSVTAAGKAVDALSQQVKLAIEADTDLAAAAALAETETSLAAALATHHGGGTSLQSAQRHLAHAVNATASARSTATSVASAILGGSVPTSSRFKTEAHRLSALESSLAGATADTQAVAAFLATHPAH